MPFNGSGMFSRLYSYVADAAAGITAQPARFDADLNDIAAGLSTTLLRDGSVLPTADISLGGRKLISVADPVSPQDAVTKNYFSTQISALPSIATLALGTGAGLIGTLASGTVQAFITSAQPVVTFVKTDGVTVGIGTAQLASRFSVQTSTAFTGNGEDIYHYSQQTNATNQTSALAIHNYTDGVSVVFDTVGAGYTLRLKQANNAAARVDQAATYVGTGGFLEFQRNRPSGGGVFPGGNIGGNNDRLTFVNPTGNLCFYGTDAQDWDGTNTKAPIQIGTYANFLNRMLYLGYRNDLNKSIIGSIDTGAAAFTYLDIAALAMRPIGDNAVSFGADSLSWSAGYFYTVKTQPFTVATLPNATTVGAGTRAFVSDSSVVALNNFGNIVAGGGASKVPVYSDLGNWRIG